MKTALFTPISPTHARRTAPLLLILLLVFALASCLGGGGGSGGGSGGSGNASAKSTLVEKYQWHINNTGQANFGGNAGAKGIDLNLAPLNGKVSGKGVLVNVVDSGLELTHEDLAANIVTGSDDLRDGVGGDQDPSPSAEDTAADGDHGTSVAGLIAMIDNDYGGIGVAPQSSLIAYNILASGVSQNSTNFAASLSKGDVVNLSLGASPGYVQVPDQDLDELIHTGLNQGRNGKGRVFIKAAGNGFATENDSYECKKLSTELKQSCETANDDSLNSLPIVVVAAVNANGEKSSYSTTGSAIWVSGLGGEFGYGDDISEKTGLYFQDTSTGEYDISIWGDVVSNLGMAMLTTDVSGCKHGLSREFSFSGNASNLPKNLFEYSFANSSPTPHPDNPNCNYTSTFNGTSAATPTVSGVVALMLEANPQLTHWDVRHILAKTSRKIDADHSLSTSSSNHKLSLGWITNDAGYHFSDWFGFGLVDAAKAVEMASTYTSYIQASQAQDTSYDSTPGNGFFVNASTAGVTDKINVSQQGEVLHLTIRPVISGPPGSSRSNALYAGRDVQIELTSPGGTTCVAQGAGHGHNTGETSSSPIQIGGSNYYVVYSLAPNSDQRLACNAFYGESIQGDWTIRVMDLFDSSDGGTKAGNSGNNYGGKLFHWSLDITYKPET